MCVRVDTFSSNWGYCCAAQDCNICPMGNNNAVFQARLREQMARRRMNRRVLGERTQRSVSSVARWLASGLEGGNVPLIPIAVALKCSAAYLTGQRDTPEPPVYLSEDERVMLGKYRELNSDEKRLIISAILEVQSTLQKAQER